MPRYKTRDPRPVNRDPVPDELPNADRPALLVTVPPKPEVKCQRPGCGCTRFDKHNATRPNMTADKMTRRKQCVKCGQWYVMQSEPTEAERARYWKK